ncbi:NUDIX hydrolase [Halovenus rubra]|uniref:NUDIX hydrolase n=2 Tax=Halovenus rubra TaxID=869890 RepID=A0ABD5X0W3_9EURY|nr:NUDIX domain-containing protein [Halovenus rubra]
MVEHINKGTVESRFERLDKRYGIDYQEAETVTVDPGDFEEERRKSRNGYIGSSYVWIVRQPEQANPLTESMSDDVHVQQRVLMILGRGGTAWGIPGGGRKQDETFEEAALREVREETSIECTIEDCFGTRHERRTSPDHDAVLHNLRVVFEGEYAGGSISVQPGELNGAAWRVRRPQLVHPLARPVAAEWFEA